MLVKKGSWVRIHDIVLTPEDRSPNIPDDTKEVPLEMWTKGFLQEDSKIGDKVTIKTITGRLVNGQLLEVNPFYDHDYGKFVPEILDIGLQLRELLWGGDDNE